MIRTIPTTIVILGLAAPSLADVIHVPGTYPTIQSAIDAAANGDEVEVAPGVYNEAINFNGKAITVRRSAQPGLTIIDASGWHTSVVKFVSDEGPDSVLDGFKIRGGTGTVWGLDTYGGGMYMFSASPTIQNCVFSGNTADAGGAMSTGFGSPMIKNCTFHGNATDGVGAGGGAVHNSASLPTFANCTFSSNFSTIGGAMTNVVSNAALTNCLFIDNHALYGAAIRNDTSSPQITNCTFVNNEATNTGGAIRNTGSSAAMVVNCISWGNSAPFGPEIVDQAGAATVVRSSTVAGGWSGAGSDNDDTDPMFVDTDSDNMRLLPGSPCIDDGVFDAALEGTMDLDGNERVVGATVDKGAYECQSSSPAPCPADIDANGTVEFDDLLVLLESWGTCPGCDADIDGNGSVDFDDLVQLVSNWGPCM